jgi:hypothetical protein
VSESADQIRRHIEVLSDFEQKYDEFLIARHNRREIPEVQWSNKEWAARERELRMLAPRADAAMEASGVGTLALHYPPALGAGLKADDLPSLIFDFKDFAGFSVDAIDDEFQQAILERIPSQIAGLDMRLEEAKEREVKPKLKLPTVTGRIRHVPPLIGFIADIGGCAVVIGFAGHFVGLW